MIPLTAGRVARRLLAFYQNDPKRWTTEAYATNAAQAAVNPEGPDGRSFCVDGALQNIIRPNENELRSRRYHEAYALLNKVFEKQQGLLNMNDSCVSFYELKTELRKIARLP